MRALVVGGGIGGLAAAIALRWAALEVTVFEQAEELREIGAGLSIWANAVRALQALGLGEAVPPIGAVIERVHLETWRGRVLGELPADAIGRKVGAPSLGIHRADLVATLAARLDDGMLRLGARCTGFDQDATGVTADFADGRRERGDLLIGADGLHSVVRTQLHGLAKPRYAGYTAWRGVTHFADPEAFPRGLTYESLGRGRRFGALHLSQGRVYWYATANLAEGSADAPEGRRRELLRRFQGWHAPVEALIAATDEPAILRHDIYDRKPVRRWGEGRVTLVGDAAHPMTPNQGQGACQAIEDAVALGAALGAALGGRLPAPVSSPDPASQVGAALRAYEARRFARTAAITNLSRQGGWVGQWENPLACGLRDVLLRVLMPTYLTRRFAKLLADDA